MWTATDRAPRSELKCIKCGGVVEPGLHICNEELLWFEINLHPKLKSILEVVGQCVACGHRCTLRDTAVDPDYSTPRCAQCGQEWKVSSATERS